MKYIEFTGKTVEDAVQEGLRSLGLQKEQADIRVLEEGKKKLFGSIPARVEIAPLCNESKENEETVKNCEEKNCANATDGQRTVTFLEGLFKLLKITACTELVSEGDKVEINVTAVNSTAVIGKHGATLDAIQTLAGAVANIGRNEYKRVVVDCENYRENRENTLNKLAENLAQKAMRTQRRVKLEPMNPYERRIIHSALSNYEGVKTESEGKEPNRYIVVIPDNEEDPTLPPLATRGERRSNDRGRRNERSRGGFSGRGKGYGNRSKNEGYKKFNRDNKGGSSSTGGTTIKPSNDFFGIFLGNSGSNGEEK